MIKGCRIFFSTSLILKSDSPIGRILKRKKSKKTLILTQKQRFLKTKFNVPGNQVQINSQETKERKNDKYDFF